jgi:hypothetical protein
MVVIHDLNAHLFLFAKPIDGVRTIFFVTELDISGHRLPKKTWHPRSQKSEMDSY